MSDLYGLPPQAYRVKSFITDVAQFSQISEISLKSATNSDEKSAASRTWERIPAKLLVLEPCQSSILLCSELYSEYLDISPWNNVKLERKNASQQGQNVTSEQCE